MCKKLSKQLLKYSDDLKVQCKYIILIPKRDFDKFYKAFVEWVYLRCFKISASILSQSR